MNSTSGYTPVFIPSSLLIFKAVAFGILILLSLCLNSLTLVVLHRMQDLKPATRVFLTSMTVVDLISLVYHIPVFVSTIMNRWPFGDIVCTVFSITSMLISALYYINLPLVNIERYIAVVRPFQYPSLVTVKRSRMAIACVWAFAFLSATVAYFIVPYEQYVPAFHVCMPTFEKTTSYAGKTSPIRWEVVLMLIFALTPVALSLVLFLRLYMISRAHAVRIAAQNRNSLWNNNTLDMERKTFITFVIMTICVTFCMVPNVITDTLYITHQGDVSYWFVCFSQLMYLANTIVNVIVYYWRTAAFRKTVKKVISFHWKIRNVFLTAIYKLDKQGMCIILKTILIGYTHTVYANISAMIQKGCSQTTALYISNTFLTVCLFVCLF